MLMFVAKCVKWLSLAFLFVCVCVDCLLPGEGVLVQRGICGVVFGG